MMPVSPIVKNLLLINIVVFIGLLFLPTELARYMAFCSPNTGYFQPFQIISHMFTHYGLSPWIDSRQLDPAHLMLNMLGLYFMGPTVEYAIGSKRFLGLYFISGFIALASYLLVEYLPFALGMSSEPFFVVYGASGAVYGVTIAYATLFPERELMLIFPPVAIKAWLLAVLLIGAGLYEGLTGINGDVAHFAHLGGALAGFILARHWKRGGKFLR